MDGTRQHHSNDDSKGRSDTGATVAILNHDPSWYWLHDEAEDVYSEADVRPLPTSNLERETLG